MKKDTKETKPATSNQTEDDDDDEELTETEKLFYQMIWGKVWDEEYPPKNKKEKK